MSLVSSGMPSLQPPLYIQLSAGTHTACKSWALHTPPHNQRPAAHHRICLPSGKASHERWHASMTAAYQSSNAMQIIQVQEGSITLERCQARRHLTLYRLQATVTVGAVLNSATTVPGLDRRSDLKGLTELVWAFPNTILASTFPVLLVSRSSDPNACLTCSCHTSSCLHSHALLQQLPD
jgi:hypothetical protein